MREPEPTGDELCPPHWFDAAWVGTEDEAAGAIYCKLCGDIRPLEFIRTPAPEAEHIFKDER